MDESTFQKKLSEMMIVLPTHRLLQGPEISPEKCEAFPGLGPGNRCTISQGEGCPAIAPAALICLFGKSAGGFSPGGIIA